MLIMQPKENELGNRLFILSRVLSVWREESSRTGLKETGGMLIGYWTVFGKAVITHATGPGPKAIHGYRYFVADHGYCQMVLDDIIDRTEGELTYLGDWHTHPLGRVSLSPLDIATMSSVSADPSYLCPNPLVAIYRPRLKVAKISIHPKIGVWIFDASADICKPMIVMTIQNIPGYPLPTL